MSVVSPPEDALTATNTAGRWALLATRASLAVRRAREGGSLSDPDRRSLRRLESTLREAADTLSYIRSPSGQRPAVRLAPVGVAIRTVMDVSQIEAGREDLVTALTHLADRIRSVVDDPESAELALADMLGAIAEDAAAEGGSVGDTVVNA